MQPYESVILDYLFSDKKVEEYDECESMLLSYFKDHIGLHGIGGKTAEKFVIKKFGWEEIEEIHDDDAIDVDGRPIEIKTETLNKTAKLNCMGSWSDHREFTEIKSVKYKREKHYIVNVAVDPFSGKVIWVLKTDTTKVPDHGILWERLSARAPRINFGHYPNEAIEILYLNKELLDTFIDARYCAIRSVKPIGKKLYNFLTF
jgi:hypothetical protein